MGLQDYKIAKLQDYKITKFLAPALRNVMFLKHHGLKNIKEGIENIKYSWRLGGYIRMF